MKKTKLFYCLFGLIVITALSFVALLAIAAEQSTSGKIENLTIQSASAEKLYDGTPLTAKEYTILSGQLKKNHKLTVNFTANQTNAGTTSNYFIATVFDKRNKDVTNQYNIMPQAGELKVNPIPITIKSYGAIKSYDGTPLTNESYQIIEGDLLASHTLFVTFTGQRTEAGESENTFIPTIKDAQNNAVTTNYAIQTVCEKLEVTKRQIAITTLSKSQVYNGKPLTCNEWQYVSSQTVLDGQWLEVEVSGSRTNAGTSTNTVGVVKVFSDDGQTDFTHNYEITKYEGDLTVLPLTIAIRSSSAQKIYDGTPLTDNTWSITSQNKPITGHLVSVEVTGTQTLVGKSENFISGVSIVYNGFDMQNNYTVILELGTLEVLDEVHTPDPNAIKIKPVDKIVPYEEGITISATNEIQGLNSFISQGYNYSAVVVGTRSTPGITKSQIQSFTLYDNLNNDVTHLYTFEYATGKVQLYLAEITITTPNISKIYDGTPLLASSTTPNISGSLLSGNYVSTVLPVVSRTNVGQSQNACTIIIADSDLQNVTDVYKINNIFGTLTVNARHITITAGTASAYYSTLSGALTCQTYTISSAQNPSNPLVDGDYEYVKIEGEQAEIGRSDNLITAVEIYNSKGVEVTDNYAITYEKGKLTVLA